MYVYGSLDLFGVPGRRILDFSDYEEVLEPNKYFLKILGSLTVVLI